MKTVKPARARFERMKKMEGKKGDQSQTSGDNMDSSLAGGDLTRLGLNVTIGEDGLPYERNDDEEGENEQNEAGEALNDSGLAEPRADQDEGMDGEEAGDEEEGDENPGRTSGLDVHASTTNISQPGEEAELEEGGPLAQADSSGQLIIKKKRTVSRSPRKAKKKVDPDAVELIEFGPSKKTKGRLIVTEKLAIP
jgi:hypothetical protein